MSKPTAILKLNGSIDRNKKRYAGRTHEPVPTGELSIAPSHLLPDEQKAWRQIRKSAFWLTDADATTVEALSIMTAKMRRREFKSASDFACLRNLLGACGMTPVDRAKLQMPPKEEKDVFVEFMETLGAEEHR